MISAIVEVTLSNFCDFVRHVCELEISAVDYKSEEDIRVIFDRYLGVEFRFKREEEEPRNTNFGLEAALKDIWSNNTGTDCSDAASLNVAPVEVIGEIEPKKAEAEPRKKIKTKSFVENTVDAEVIKFGPNVASGKMDIEKQMKLEMSVVDSILDSKTDRGMKIEKLDKILIVPKDKKFKDITQCSLCMFQASSSHTLKVHIEMTHLNLRFHCNICQRSSKEKYVMKDHMKKIHEEEDLCKLEFECGRCDLREPFKSFRDHINLFHPDLIFFYPNHPFKYFNPRGRVSLRIQPYAPKIKTKADMKCSFCAYSSPLPNLLNLHVESSHINAEYRCNACDFTCKNVMEIRNHTNNNHAPDGIKRTGIRKGASSKELKQFFQGIISKKCITCGQNMEYREDFSRHIYLNHPDSFVRSKRKRRGDIKEEDLSKYYHCSECDYSSKFITNLRSHIMLIHMKTKFSCKDCTFQSNILAITKKHVRSDHDNRRELINSLCTKCGYAEDSFPKFESHIKKSHTSHINIPKGRGKGKSKKKEKRAKKMKKKRGRKAKVVYHDEKPTYTCTDCDLETHDKDNIIEHIFENHDVNEDLEEDEQLDDIVKYLKVSCTNCKFKGSFTEYNKHFNTNSVKKHEKIDTQYVIQGSSIERFERFVCEVCDKAFSRQDNRDAHMTQCLSK